MTAIAPARTLTEVIEQAKRCPCGHCWRDPGSPCTTDPETGADGLHVARFARAYRRGLLTETEFAAVLHSVVVFTNDTVIWGQP